ncbi:MAG: Gfo/Idh/MocA family oxidoreductase [Clostridiales bacterium]|nr:Gfo/Idh/MocA family oxidoreductase [Clostridiales bacterium]
MKKLKVGIIGTGGISHAHMDGYKALPELVDVVACCDIDGEKVKKYAEKFSVPHYYTDCAEMMKNEELDCVSVCTWNSAHKECTITALNGGANVICEKPMAMNAAEAEEMLEAANKNGKLLQVGFVRRFGKDAEIVQKFAKEGVTGDIYYAKAQYLRRDGCPGGWFKDKAFSGGGPLIDLGVHVIDLTRYLAGDPKPVSAFGVTFDNLGPNRASGGQMVWNVDGNDKHPYTVEDFAGALVKFENGFTLQVETSFNLNIRRDVGDVYLFGTKAGVKISGNVELYSDIAGSYVDIMPAGNTGFDFSKAFNAEIKGFIDAVNGVEPCRASGEDGVWLMKIIDAIYESARTGKSVDIK